MAVLRSQVERVEVVGLDEAYLDLTGLDRYRSAARRVKEAVRARDRPHLLGRDRAEQAGGEGGLRRREARRLRGAERRGRASASRTPPPASCRASGPRRSRASSSSGSRRWRASAPRPTSSSSSGSAPRLGPHLARAGALRGRARIETVRVAKSESRETTFDHDLRGLPQLEPVLERLTGELCETLAREERRGRTIGIKVRFDDFSTVTRARSLDAAVNDTRDRRNGRAGAAAAPRSAPPGAAPGRARGRPRRGVRARLPDDQLSLSL